MKSLTEKHEIDSAGTSGFHAGEPADSRMRAAGKSRGIPVTSISRQLIPQDLEDFDYILTMDDSNYQNTVALNPALAQKVHKFCDYLDGEFSHFDHVPDPYYGGDEGFDLVLDLLNNGCRNFLAQLEE